MGLNRHLEHGMVELMANYTRWGSSRVMQNPIYTI